MFHSTHCIVVLVFYCSGRIFNAEDDDLKKEELKEILGKAAPSQLNPQNIIYISIIQFSISISPTPSALIVGMKQMNMLQG